MASVAVLCWCAARDSMDICGWCGGVVLLVLLVPVQTFVVPGAVLSECVSHAFIRSRGSYSVLLVLLVLS